MFKWNGWESSIFFFNGIEIISDNRFAWVKVKYQEKFKWIKVGGSSLIIIEFLYKNPSKINNIISYLLELFDISEEIVNKEVKIHLVQLWLNGIIKPC